MNTHPNPPEGRELCPAISFMKGYDCTLVVIEINIVMPYNKLYEEAFLNCFDA